MCIICHRRKSALENARAPRSAIRRLVAILRAEGVQGIYAGFTPKAMRMGLGGAVGILTFEMTKRLLAG